MKTTEIEIEIVTKIASFVILILLSGCVISGKQQRTEFYISPDGDNRANGSKARPWRTLERARDHIRTINQNMLEDITV